MNTLKEGMAGFASMQLHQDRRGPETQKKEKEKSDVGS